MRDKIKLNSLAVELRRDWDLNPYSPIDLFSIVLSKLPDLTILFYPMSDNTSGMCIKDINGIDVTILDEESGKALLSVKDIKHVNQLKEALDKLPREKRKIAHVNLKADKDTSMEEITAIKQVLREYHILQLNMEVNKTIVKNGQGTLYQQQTITKKKK